MSMSTHVIGLRDEADPEYQKMKNALHTLRMVGEETLPPVLAKYFGQDYDEPCELPEKAIEVEIPTKDWGDEAGEGIEILVADIPKGVKKIRFYNSW